MPTRVRKFRGASEFMRRLDFSGLVILWSSIHTRSRCFQLFRFPLRVSFAAARCEVLGCDPRANGSSLGNSISGSVPSNRSWFGSLFFRAMTHHALPLHKPPCYARPRLPCLSPTSDEPQLDPPTLHCLSCQAKPGLLRAPTDQTKTHPTLTRLP